MKSESRPILRFQNIRVQFDGVVAVDLEELDLFDQSRLVVFLGPNGAGKSSLINAATGYAPVRPPGRVMLESGSRFELSSLSRDRIVRAGVARTFQTPALFPSLTVEESLLLAAMFGQSNTVVRRFLSLFRNPKHDRESARLVERLIQEFELGSVAQARMDKLPCVTVRRAEIARSLAVQPRVLFLDEPSAGADKAETDFLVGLLAGRLASLISSLFGQGLYRHSALSVGLVTHDRALLDGLVRSCDEEPIAHYFDGGQLKFSSPLGRWLDSVAKP